MVGKKVYSSRERQDVLTPLAEKILSLAHPEKTIIVGIQGGQGTGKTTLVKFLEDHLRKKRLKVVSFSVDDFYASYAQRKHLQQKHPHNPFYQISRGLPGTHRITYLLKVLDRLKRGKSCSLPVFDKSLHHAAGDISPKTIEVKSKVDIVLFEGWCVGIPSITSAELVKVCRKNKIILEKIDPSLQHHKLVLEYIKQYQPLWDYLDYMIQLRPNDSRLHFRWRWQQERELKKSTGHGMTREQVEHFVFPYLPFTYVCYEKVKANATIMVNKEHKMYNLK